MPKKQIFTIIFFVAGIGFLLNLAWENLQAPLFQGFTAFEAHFPKCFRASLGDILIILALYLIFSFFHGDWAWFRAIKKVDMITLILAGILVGVLVEKAALDTHRWEYGPNMPLIPFTQIGLLPVLQMALLPLLTFSLTKRATQKP